MVMTEKDAAGIGTVAAGWEDEDDETGYRTTSENNSWGCQSTMDGGTTGG